MLGSKEVRDRCYIRQEKKQSKTAMINVFLLNSKEISREASHSSRNKPAHFTNLFLYFETINILFILKSAF